MYKKLVALDKNIHKELKINPVENLNFAKNMGFIPVLAQEIEQIASNFPVVFTTDETPILVSVVSLGSQNLALNNDGKWITSYIPSMIRKYPFHLATTKENPNNRIILIDQESELLSTTQGKPLFDDEGIATEILQNTQKYLTGYEQQSIITSNLLKEIQTSGILEDREIAMGEGEKKQILVNGFQIVDKEKLYKLDDTTLAKWARKGVLSFIDQHLKSLDNIQKLFHLLDDRQQ